MPKKEVSKMWDERIGGQFERRADGTLGPGTYVRDETTHKTGSVTSGKRTYETISADEVQARFEAYYRGRVVPRTKEEHDERRFVMQAHRALRRASDEGCVFKNRGPNML